MDDKCPCKRLHLHEDWLWCLDCEEPYDQWRGYVPEGKIVTGDPPAEAAMYQGT